MVDGGSGLETRNHPVTTAADGLQTSTPGALNSHVFGLLLQTFEDDIEPNRTSSIVRCYHEILSRGFNTARSIWETS